MKLEKPITMPKGFLWGTAACAHQTEGGNALNDWWDFEQKPGVIRNGDKSGKACNHFEMYDEDFKILADMGTNSHRLGIEWSRICPTEKDIDRAAIDHYRRVLDSAKKHGLEIFATTHHFSSPLWFAKKGGFLVDANLDHFKRFIEIIAKELSPHLKYWNTINEPAVYAVMGWMAGEFPPGHKDMGEAARVLRNIILAHAVAYRGLKEHSPNDVLVGIVKNMPHFVPADPKNEIDVKLAEGQDSFFNEYQLRGIETGLLGFGGQDEEFPELKGSTDFYGLNYYIRNICSHKNPLDVRNAVEGERTSQMGWGVHPEGLRVAMMRLKKYGKPIYITENGIGTDDDKWRVEYIALHFAEIEKANKAGADVRGYFYWSNIDNFEWAQGWYPKFGLISFDPKTFKRTVKGSGKFFGECAKAGAVTPQLVAKYS